MTPQEAMSALHLINYIIIILVTTIVYCAWLVIYRLYRMSKAFKESEKAFIESPYYQNLLRQLKEKEVNHAVNDSTRLEENQAP